MPNASRMEQRKRTLIFFTFFTCTACLTLLTASLATHKWIVAHPLRSIAFNTSIFPLPNDDSNNDDFEMPKKFRGEIYFGLFQGTKVLNYGLGDRTAIIWCKLYCSCSLKLIKCQPIEFNIIGTTINSSFISLLQWVIPPSVSLFTEPHF